ncbi:MAG: hypothetical protein Q4A12_03510 [Eubacteriales bacterium]|nr:hypothetical protein [Eubacteriales bacterium]
MKNNLYTEHIQKIKAPDSLIENTIEAMREADSVEQTQDKPKRVALKLTGIVAAMLALIIGLSFIPFGNGNVTNGEHNFVITVGAAEITPDVYVEVGELVNYGSGASFKEIGEDKNSNLWDGEEHDETAYDLNDENVDVPDDMWISGMYHLIGMQRMFMPQNLNIQGENIESITYSVKNCRLVYDDKFEGVIDADTLSDKDLVSNGEPVIRYYNGYKWAKSCTFDYKIQQESIQSGKWQGTPKFGLEFAMTFEEGEHEVFIEKNKHDESPLFENEFNSNADDYELNITANFKDGKSVTKTLKFKCKNTKDRGLVLYAKEV